MHASVLDVVKQSFDFIVIGGGTAGLALASRLSEDATVSILVLEAGEAHLNDPILLTPWSRAKYLNNKDYDWSFKTVAQTHSNDRSYVWPRGKCLGGSSAMNFMLWNKPAREYLDALEELGNPGWNWESFNRYSLRAECFTPPNHDTDLLTYDPAHRGTSGPVATYFPLVLCGLERRARQAFSKHGIHPVIDSSSGNTNGANPTSITAEPKTFHRAYSANTYFTASALRENLTVLVSAYVSRLVLGTNADGSVTASGAIFRHGDQEYEVHCKREICVCAGTIMSPQILERSGIGRRNILEKAGVEVKVELPGVGENIQEHLYHGAVFELKKDTVDGVEIQTLDALMDPMTAKDHMTLFPSGKGAFHLHANSLIFTSLETISQDAERLNRVVSDTIMEGIEANSYPSGLRKQYEIQLRWLQEKVPSLEIVFAPGPVARPSSSGKKHITMVIGLNSPFSRGTIHITSQDPFAEAEIDPRVFEQKYDLDSLVEAVKFVREFVKTEPLSEFINEVDVYPGPECRSDDQIADWLKNNISTTYHTIGSCSMLPERDGGVVDPRLKVYNTTNVRVVDLSIMPLHVGSHTLSLAYAIAEQGADIIKGLI